MIGIICAMESETKAMCAQMDAVNEKQLFGIRVYEGRIAEHDVVVANSGVGKVNAAISTTLLLSQYAIDTMINVGVAGGLLETQNVFDVIVANHVVQHDFDTSPIDGEEGIGLVSPCDEKLANCFATALEKMGVTVWQGDIASGDVFVTLHNHYERIRKQFPNCACCEMEAGAIAQVCDKFTVPCLIVRSLSDVAPKSGNAVDFLTFVEKAADIAGKACRELIQSL